MARQLRPCGTRAAYRRHLAAKELACEACLRAIAEENRRYRPAPTVRGPYSKPECGTPSGYSKHVRQGEETCQACRAAVAAYQRQYRALRAAQRGGR